MLSSLDNYLSQSLNSVVTENSFSALIDVGSRDSLASLRSDCQNTSYLEISSCSFVANRAPNERSCQGLLPKKEFLKSIFWGEL